MTIDLDKEKLTLEDIANHSAKHGRKATATLLHILGRKRPYYDALMDEKCQLILHSVFLRMDELLEKIVVAKNSDEERIEYDILRKLANEWAQELVNYRKHKDKLKGK